jgi:hypothetical protein
MRTRAYSVALGAILALGIATGANALALTGQFTGYFSSHESCTQSVDIPIGGAIVPTGTLYTRLDLTHPENSYEVIDFDNMTVREEVDTILDSSLLQKMGISPLRIHSTLTGTFTITSLTQPSADTVLFELETHLSGDVLLPPGRLSMAGYTGPERNRR